MGTLGHRHCLRIEVCSELVHPATRDGQVPTPTPSRVRAQPPSGNACSTQTSNYQRNLTHEKLDRVVHGCLRCTVRFTERACTPPDWLRKLSPQIPGTLLRLELLSSGRTGRSLGQTVNARTLNDRTSCMRNPLDYT